MLLYLFRFGYSNANLQTGEQFTIEQLLNVLLIPSANDAAVVLSEHIAGTVEEFVAKMNQKALSLGCKDTNFVNPNGIHNDNQYTTAYDLALIGNYAMKNEIFANIVSKTSYSLPATGKYLKEDRVFTTTNDLLRVNSSTKPDNYYYQYATGVKTGYTSQAKNCLVAGAKRDSLNFICVILGAMQDQRGISYRYSDVKKLFDFGFEYYSIKKINSKDSLLKEIEIKNATNDTKNLGLIVQDEISVLIGKEDLDKNILPEITLNDNLAAPIGKDQVVGTIKYNIEGIEYTSNLLAQSDVKKISILGVLFKILIVLVLLYTIYIIIFRQKKIKKRGKKSYSSTRNYRI